MYYFRHTAGAGSAASAFFLTLVVIAMPTGGRADECQTAEECEISADRKYSEKDYAGARADFLKAYQYGSDPWVVANAAKCTDEMGEYKEAFVAYKTYLSLETDPASYQYLIDHATKRIAELPSQFARLVIEDTPENATLHIDKERVEDNWKTQPVILNPGEYEITVFSKGYIPRTKTLTLKSGIETFVSFKLTKEIQVPLKTRVNIVCNEEKSRIYIDKKLIGSCSAGYDVLPGKHTLKVKARGMRRLNQSFLVERGQPLDIPAKLEPFPWGKLGIAAISTGAVVVGLGGFFTYQWDRYYDLGSTATANANDLVEKMRDPTENKDKYDDYDELYDEEAASAKSNYEKKDKYHAGMIAAYITGGVLAAIGTGFLVHYLRNNNKGRRYDVSVYSSNLVVEF